MREVIPYFRCYAENIIADRHYRSMSLLERGLWISIYLECWPNVSVPADRKKMAKVLGFGEEEISKIQMDQIMYFFSEVQGEITSPELNALRDEFMETRRKKAEGGKEGARRKKEKQLGNAQGIPKGSSIQVKSSQVISSQIKPCRSYLESGENEDSQEFDSVAKEYLIASRG
jgi:uncharacterized protein YdaU (DUF1376 family)